MTSVSEAPKRGSLGLLDVSPWIAILPATLLTFLFSGYAPIFNNNIYHLPIMLESWNLPQFQDDAFIQSLRNFSSGFWLLFSGVGHYIAPRVFLTVWLGVTHLAFLAAGLHFAGSLGYRDRRQLNLFVLLFAVSSMTVGLTVGGGGLMLSNFTHSELANATMIFGLSFALRRQYGQAAVLTCATFFLNAFMAVWMIAPLLLLAVYQLSAGTLSVSKLLRDGLVGSAVGLVFLLPPLLNIVNNPELAAPLDFSYPEFLWDFYPPHFFLNSVPVRELIKLLGLLLILFLSVRFHGRKSMEFQMVALGAVAVIGIGALVPEVTDARLVLNLHLIRGAVMVAILAPFSLALVVSHWLLSPQNTFRKRYALMLAGILIAPIQLSPLAVLVLGYVHIAERRASRPKGRTDRFLNKAAWGFLALCIVVVPVRAYKAIRISNDDRQAVEAWGAVGTWARHGTPAQATFLLFPVAEESPEVGFEETSMRGIWFAGKFGAAVMWSPSYYPLWQSRMMAFTRLATPQQRLQFALLADIDYLAMPCDRTVTQEPAHREGPICIYRTSMATGYASRSGGNLP